jgi:Ca2+-binding EF-hand superfamily protein
MRLLVPLTFASLALGAHPGLAQDRPTTADAMAAEMARAEFLRAADTNQDGTVDYFEHARYLGDNFRVLDEDRDEIINSEEMANASPFRLPVASPRPSGATPLRADGLTERDYVNARMDAFVNTDWDRDGRLTVEEAERYLHHGCDPEVCDAAQSQNPPR